MKCHRSEPWQIFQPGIFRGKPLALMPSFYLDPDSRFLLLECLLLFVNYCLEQAWCRFLSFFTTPERGGRILGCDWDKSLKIFPPCYSQSPLLTDFTIPPLPLSRSDLRLVCNVNIVNGKQKSENSQDYAQKPQWICTSWIQFLYCQWMNVQYTQKSAPSMDINR